MTISEAIKHCEEVANENREYAEDALDRYNLVPNDITKQEHDRCKQCAAEHRQLAEWLKDYKRLLEQEPCEDAISREAAIKAVCGLCDKSTGIFEENPHIDAIWEALEKLPSVKPVCKPISAEVKE